MKMVLRIFIFHIMKRKFRILKYRDRRPGSTLPGLAPGALLAHLERFCHRQIETAPLPKLRCADANAGTVANFVDLVEQIDDA
jgi:hypothetical protein